MKFFQGILFGTLGLQVIQSLNEIIYTASQYVCAKIAEKIPQVIGEQQQTNCIGFQVPVEEEEEWYEDRKRY